MTHVYNDLCSIVLKAKFRGVLVKIESIKGVFLFCLLLIVLYLIWPGEDPPVKDQLQSENTTQEINPVVPPVGEFDATQERVDDKVDYKKEYTRAIEALKKEDYERAAEYFSNAVKGENKEKLMMPFYGINYGPYLPHFFLGQIAFLTGDCKSALQHWKTSLTQGVIRESPNFAFIKESTKTCKSGA